MNTMSSSTTSATTSSMRFAPLNLGRWLVWSVFAILLAVAIPVGFVISMWTGKARQEEKAWQAKQTAQQPATQAGHLLPQLAHLLHNLSPTVLEELKLAEHGLAFAASDLPPGAHRRTFDDTAITIYRA